MGPWLWWWSNHNIPRATFNGCCWWFVAVCQGEKWIGDQEVVDEELLASGSAPPTPVNRRRGEAREGTRWTKYFEMASKTMWQHEKDDGDAKDRQMVGEWSERWRPGLKEQPKSELVVKHVEQLAAEKVIKRFKYRCLSIKRPYKNFIGRRLLKVSGWCHHVSNVLPLWIRHYLRVRWRWKPFYIS